MNLLFFLGLLLGDGSFLIRLRRTQKGVLIIPIVWFSQKNWEANNSLFDAIIRLLNLYNIPFSQYQKKERIIIIEGINNVLFNFLPLLKQYSHFWYWKSTQLQLFLILAFYLKSGAHHIQQGLLLILNIIYSFPHNRKEDLNYWNTLIKFRFNNQGLKSKSGYQGIRVHSNNQSGISAWKVVFSSELKPKLPSKIFPFKHYQNKNDALIAAKNYRDLILDDRIKYLISKQPKKKD